jgi:SnoaL-like domain
MQFESAISSSLFLKYKHGEHNTTPINPNKGTKLRSGFTLCIVITPKGNSIPYVIPPSTPSLQYPFSPRKSELFPWGLQSVRLPIHYPMEKFGRFTLRSGGPITGEGHPFSRWEEDPSGPPPDGERYVGQAQVGGIWERFFRSSPSAIFETEEIFAAGDRGVIRWLYRWVDGAGKPGHIRGVDVVRVRDGKVAEKFSYVKG